MRPGQCGQHLAECGVHHVEFFNKHVPLNSTPEQINAVLKLCSDHGVTPVAYGVEGFTKDHEANKKKFDLGKALGIKVLTLYAFSIENWKRPAAEISTLMMLLKRYLRSELRTLLTNDIKFNVIGRMDDLADELVHQQDLRLDVLRAVALVLLARGGRKAERRSISARLLPAIH